MRRLFYEVINPTIIASPVVFASIGYPLSSLFPLSIQAWSAILIASALLCGVVFAVLSRQGKVVWVDREAVVSEQVKGRRLVRGVGYLPYMVFVPGIAALLLSTVLQVSNHGDLHTTYIHQLLHGLTPPTNASLPGYPPNYYWLYHALLAAIVNILNISAPLASLLLNVISLVSALGWIILILRLLGVGYRHGLLLGLLAVSVLKTV